MIYTLVFLLYVLGTYILAAILLTYLHLPIPLDKAIYYGGIFIAVLGFWPLLRSLGLANYTTLGYMGPRRLFLISIVLGLLVGIAILSCLSLGLLLLGIRYYTPGVSLLHLPKVILEGLLIGLTVAFIEETFFRGALYAAIRRHTSTATAAILGSSVLYAALHFLRPQPLSPESPVTIIAAINSIVLSIPAMLQLQNLDSFSGLLMAGILLAMVRERTGQLGWGIGIHAGWVVVIKVFHVYTDVNHSSPLVSLVGNYDGMVGWLATGWLFVLIILNVQRHKIYG